MSTATSGSSKQASEAAAAAAAIAAKIAAQFASGGGGMGGMLGGNGNDAAFTHDIDINDARNRYMLCKSSTQQEIQEETGASISTKGTWIPTRSKATEKDPPLYLHIMAPTKEILEKAIQKVDELLAIDMGSLVEDKKDRGAGRRKWPEEKMPVGLDSIRNFNVRAKVVGPSVCRCCVHPFRFLMVFHRDLSLNTSSKKQERVYKSRVSVLVSSSRRRVRRAMSRCIYI